MNGNCEEISTGIDEFGNVDFVQAAEFLDFIKKYPTGLKCDSSLDPDERSKRNYEFSKYNPSWITPMLSPTSESVAEKINVMLDQSLQLPYCYVCIPAINDYLACLRRELHSLRISGLPKLDLPQPTLIEVITTKDNRMFGELFEQYNEFLLVALKMIQEQRGTATISTQADAKLESQRLASSGKEDADAEMQRDETMLRAVGIYSDGVSNPKLQQVAHIIQGSLSINDKLFKIDAIIPIPANRSSAQLGAQLGVSGSAIKKTMWWVKHRQGKQPQKQQERFANHISRARQSVGDVLDDNDD